MRPRVLAWLVAPALLGGLLTPGVARAYTYDSPISDGCHESITAAALRTARDERPAAAPIDATRDEQALIGDVPFALPPDLRDLAGATLLLAVRDNDLKGRHPTDTDQLALVHGNPSGQREHCLRRPSQDEPGGTEAALADCRAFIAGRVRGALDGLDATSRPDPADRTDLRVFLAIRGEVTAALPRYYVRIGQALHALQDGFTHTLRTEDGMRVTVALNWIEFVEGTLDEARDGPPHMTGMDRCDAPDDLRARRRDLAEQASTELLLATLDPALDRGAKEDAADAIVARYLSYEPGCTYDNGWCDAPELSYRDEGACACSAAGQGAPRGAAACLAAAALLAALRQRRRA